jgi:hypothetical protein
VLFGS